MLYEEWTTLFEQTTSVGVRTRGRLRRELEAVGMPNAEVTKALFVLHTYHALVFKILAAEMVLANVHIPGNPEGYCLETLNKDRDAFLRSLETDIEESELFRRSRIHNLIEGTFLAWYLDETPDAVVEAIRGVIVRVLLYKLSGLRLDQTRDLVKRLYQSLVPATLRHNIGEYFTPEWLVEFTLMRAGYRGRAILDARVLDPCCGSGNFLIHAIAQYKAEALAQGWEPPQILTGILDHVLGIDLNPLAVVTARINYLFAISDLLAVAADIDIPVYQADAVYAPRLAKSLGIPVRRYTLGARPIDLELPDGLVQNRHLLEQTLGEMERGVGAGNLFDTCWRRLRESKPGRNVDDRWKPLLATMYEQIEELASEGRDHIWFRIVRNYFASVAIGRCRFIVGNPPWVRWSELPASYRERIKPTCESYDIFSREKFFGGNELDISGMITYTVADNWLEHAGTLAFIITGSNLLSASAAGFRRFSIPPSRIRGATSETPLRIGGVDDFQALKPFEGLANHPAVVVFTKGSVTQYPVPYRIWRRTQRRTIPDDTAYEEARAMMEDLHQDANLLQGNGRRWVVLGSGRFPVLKNLDGRDPLVIGRKGILTDLNGAYFVSPIARGREGGTVVVRSEPARGDHDIPKVVGEVEEELLYPLLKGGRDIRAFFANITDRVVIIPNRTINATQILNRDDFGTKFPHALRYFDDINQTSARRTSVRHHLEERSTYKSRILPTFEKMINQGRLRPGAVPFWSIYDVGSYTFDPFKVVWGEIAGGVQAAVVSSHKPHFFANKRVVVPDHKVYFASFDYERQAHFVCALMNATPVREFIDGFTSKLAAGTIFKQVHLPPFDERDDDHSRLASLSKQAHTAAAGCRSVGDYDLWTRAQPLRMIQAQIDGIAERLIAKMTSSTT